MESAGGRGKRKGTAPLLDQVVSTLFTEAGSDGQHAAPEMTNPINEGFKCPDGVLSKTSKQIVQTESSRPCRDRFAVVIYLLGTKGVRACKAVWRS